MAHCCALVVFGERRANVGGSRADRDPEPADPATVLAMMGSTGGSLREIGLKVNVGCGATPTPGFVNLDNSLSVRLASLPCLPHILTAFNLIGREEVQFMAKAKELGVRWADATRRLPLADGTVALLYSSHMIEHLTRTEAQAFLCEAYRILRPGGWIRIAAPDLRRQATRYVQRTCDADDFVEATSMHTGRPDGLAAKLKWLATGPRHHLWMYDGPSLVKLLQRHGFVGSLEVQAGETNAPDPGALDLHERADDSVYVEGQKPSSRRAP